MSLPYENAISGERAIKDIQKILREFGCTKFGHMEDIAAGELLLQFEYRERAVSVRASSAGYAAAWLKAHPASYHGNALSQEKRVRKAKEIAAVAVYSILRDWIKGQITAVETGILSFEGAFLGSLLLPSGKTVLEAARDQKLLPAPTNDGKVVILKT
jgi:hypothetical protein